MELAYSNYSSYEKPQRAVNELGLNVLPNSFIKDKRVSFQSLEIAAYAMSKNRPNLAEWVLNQKDVQNNLEYKKYTFNKSINELTALGYLNRTEGSQFVKAKDIWGFDKCRESQSGVGYVPCHKVNMLRQLQNGCLAIYLFIQSHPEGWRVTIKEIANRFGFSDKNYRTVKPLLRILVDKGYIHVFQHIGGKWSLVSESWGNQYARTLCFSKKDRLHKNASKADKGLHRPVSNDDWVYNIDQRNGGAGSFQVDAETLLAVARSVIEKNRDLITSYLNDDDLITMFVSEETGVREGFIQRTGCLDALRELVVMCQGNHDAPTRADLGKGVHRVKEILLDRKTTNNVNSWGIVGMQFLASH